MSIQTELDIEKLKERLAEMERRIAELEAARKDRKDRDTLTLGRK